ncbi:MAG TPA: HAD-IIIA family hydrolase [Candidatus Saccharimonadales bacterium]|nr:HAD-IIIA family hydrolase [Candidatus Saccharimonadales bacterium]
MKVVFMDRDGTIIQDPPDERVDSVEKIELFPDSIEALKLLAENGFSAVLITNQAGIGEGRITEDEFWKIHEAILAQLAPSGIKFLKTYMNGERAGPKATEWRKPGPKMLLKAAEDLHLDLKDIYMVGDSQSDITAGINAGCKGSILVETARNKKVVSPDAIYSAANLLDAARYIITNS